LKLYMSNSDAIACPLFFDLFAEGKLEDEKAVKRYVKKKMSSFTSAERQSIIGRIRELKLLGEKQYAEPGPGGFTGVEKAKYAEEKAQAAVSHIVNIIRSMRNLMGSLTTTPATLAFTANSGEFDAIAAYGLGQKQAFSLRNLLVRLYEAAAGRGRNRAIIDDLNSFREMLQST